MDETTFLSLLISLLNVLKRPDKHALFSSVQSVDGFRELKKLSKEEIEKKIKREIIRKPNFEEAEIIAEKTEKICTMRGIKLISFYDKNYPPLLRESFEPSILLYYRGELPNPEKPLAGIVGTRHPSSEAKAWSYKCGFDLGRAGIGVVSGLALGIDAQGHRGNIEGGGKTVAVLGTSIDIVYPPSNRTLFSRIIESGGCVLTEYPLGTHAGKWTFPDRNRIISGLSRGVVIVEAPLKSGALITARHAISDSRDIWISSAGVSKKIESAGTLNLSEQGAKVISGAADILEEWKIDKAPDKEKNAELKKAFSIKSITEDLEKELGL